MRPEPEPRVVGINRTQDGSVAVAVGASTVYTLQKERLTRRKHHWGRLGDLPDRYLPAMAALREPVDLTVGAKLHAGAGGTGELKRPSSSRVDDERGLAVCLSRLDEARNALGGQLATPRIS